MLKRLLICTLAISFSSLVVAEDFTSKFYIAPGIHGQSFGPNVYGDGFNLDPAAGFNIGIGHRYKPNWAVELSYHNTGTEPEDSDVEVDSEYLHLDSLFHFFDKNDDGLAAYLVGGVGRQILSATDYEKSDVQLNAGLGISLVTDKNLSIRSDLRGTLGEDDTDTGAIFNIAFVYNLFDGGKSTQTEKKPKKVVNNDEDGDGVANKDDDCPDTKAGAKVNAKGCYEELKEEKKFTLRVRFRTGSADIEAETKPEIEELATFLKSYPDTNVTIEGHSDSVGSDELNKALSQKRADAVKSSLVADFGVDAGRITSIGYGEEKPIADNNTEKGRAKNRRVVAKVRNK